MFDIFKGLTVIEGAAFVAAPLAGLTLAQLGANVIRFDMIGGGIDYKRMPLAKETGESLYWTGLNKGKKSIAVNLNDEKGRDLITRLITSNASDGLFLTNFSGVKWLDFNKLRQLREDIVKVELQGNNDGSTAVDYTVNCSLGYPSVTGNGGPDNPVNHVLPAWDVAAGYYAAIGILAALRSRESTGQAQHVKLALSDVGYSVVSHLGHIAEAQINDDERGAIGNSLYGAFGRDFETRDGKRFMVVAISPKQWHGLCKATETKEAMANLEQTLQLDFMSQEDRYQGSDAIARIIELWAAEKTYAEVAECFDQHGVCWGTYRTFKEMVAEDPFVSESNPMFDQILQPGIGTHLAAGSPLRFHGHTRNPVEPAPVLGQHTDEILTDILSLSDTEIASLHDQGIVAAPA